MPRGPWRVGRKGKLWAELWRRGGGLAWVGTRMHPSTAVVRDVGQKRRKKDNSANEEQLKRRADERRGTRVPGC